MMSFLNIDIIKAMQTVLANKIVNIIFRDCVSGIVLKSERNKTIFPWIESSK